MKNLTTTLRDGDLKPKERVLLLVQNYVAKDQTGKEILTETDKYALCEGWRPKDNNEVKEYNRFNEGWRTEGCMRMDAQTAYLQAVIAVFYVETQMNFATWANYENKVGDYLKRISALHLGIDEDEALTTILQNSGLGFEYLIYTYAFESLGDAFKKDILTLYPDAKTESGYLDEEEVIASLFDDKKRLSNDDREKLADLIVNAMHNKYDTVFKEKGLKSTEWYLNVYYADVPAIQIVRRWATDNNIYTPQEMDDLETKDISELQTTLIEKMQSYAETHGTSIREVLKKTVLAWLDDGLLIDEYVPLCHSKSKSTCNDADTMLSHDKIFAAWITAKENARAMIQGLVDTGKLQIEHRHRGLWGAKEPITVITGESLYHLEGNFAFADDYKIQADAFRAVASLTLFLNQHEFLNRYAALLGFAEIAKRLSKTYEIDLAYKITSHVTALGAFIEHLNNILRHMADEVDMSIYKEHHLTFLIEIFMDDMIIHLEKIKPGEDEIVQQYLGEFEKILGNDF